jgi:hypothetical protein
MSITQELVHEFLDYNSITGKLIWRFRPNGSTYWNSKCAGKPASSGRNITINHKTYQTSHVIWLHYYGVWPTNEIDHIDLNPFNNAIVNLRPATRSQNESNTKMRINNTTGVKGVVKTDSGRYAANVTYQGKTIWLGRYNTIEEATKVRQQKFEELFGEYARHE